MIMKKEDDTDENVLCVKIALLNRNTNKMS